MFIESRTGRFACVVCLIAGLWLVVSTSSAEDAGQGDAPPQATEEAAPLVDFALTHNIGEDGSISKGPFKETKAWHVTNFYGRAEVRVEGDTVILEKGNDMTGITWRGPLVRMNYEITLEAKRVAGDDFFCGLTFPYGPDPCSLIVGGWGGTVVGISCLDYNDAYNNETARFIEFEKDRWYRIRLRCTPKKIEAWIDDKQIVDVETAGRKIGIRWEVEKSKPLGIATWCTTGAIRNVKLHAFPGESGVPEGPKKLSE